MLYVVAILWPAHWSEVPGELTTGTESASNPLQLETRSEQEGGRATQSAFEFSMRPSSATEDAPYFFQAEAIAAQLVYHVCIMMTFGLASPPLMVSIIVACLITFVMWKVSLGRFLSFRSNEVVLVTRYTRENKSSQVLSSAQIANLIKKNVYLQQIEKSLENIESSFDLVSRPLVICSALFVSFLCYDMVANDSSSPHSSVIAIPIATLSVPFVMRFSLAVYNKYVKKPTASQ
jgi:hypothetical protein